jgi:hypothetical protein
MGSPNNCTCSVEQNITHTYKMMQWWIQSQFLSIFVTLRHIMCQPRNQMILKSVQKKLPMCLMASLWSLTWAFMKHAHWCLVKAMSGNVDFSIQWNFCNEKSYLSATLYKSDVESYFWVLDENILYNSDLKDSYHERRSRKHVVELKWWYHPGSGLFSLLYYLTYYLHLLCWIRISAY